jgi:hypothetical protein
MYYSQAAISPAHIDNVNSQAKETQIFGKFQINI